MQNLEGLTVVEGIREGLCCERGEGLRDIFSIG
jgi:hypothetical protein